MALQLCEGGIRWGSHRNENHWTLMKSEVKKEQLLWRKNDGSVAFVWRPVGEDGNFSGGPSLPPGPPPQQQPQSAVPEAADSELTGKEQHRSPGGKADEEGFVHLELITYGVRFDKPKPTYLDLNIDLRLFRDPGAGPLKTHDGHHPDIMARLVEHPEFEDFLRSVRRQIEAKVEERRRAADKAGGGGEPIFVTLRVGLYCKSGRHRSVAFGNLMHYIGENHDSLFRSVDLCHQDLNAHGRERCDCTICMDENLQRRELAKCQALEYWKNAV